jgi:hypothetical protein
VSGLWVVPADLGADWEDSEYAAEACQAASYLMWTLSGRKYSGTHTVTERYVRFTPLINTRLLQEAAVINSRVNKALQIVEPWVMAETRIRLRGQFVKEIITIRNVAGNIVTPDSYYLVEQGYIQFSEGALIVPADIEVTYTYGSEPPVMGKMAARRVAIEFIRLWTGDEDCALPQRVTSVSRQGVSYTILDSQDFLQEMRLGIYEVDLFLKANNPNKAQKRAKVFSPDISMARRYTPKSPVLATSARDLVVAKTGTTTKTLTLASINAQFLYTESGWTPEVVLRSYANSKSLSLQTSAITVTSTNVSFVVSYVDAVGVVKLADPGTWDLYATKNGATTYITSGNLSIDVQS